MHQNKLRLPFLEMMATQACNIACYGCSNYSELPNKGYLPWVEAKAQIEPWLNILDLVDFGIIGGEPLLNPDINEWIIGSRKLLRHAQIRFTTNGLLLDKHPEIFNLLQEIGNCVFKITVHTHDDRLEEYIKRLLSEHDWVQVEEFGISRWKTKNNLRLQINRPSSFLKTFRNSYSNMEPHDNDPQEAFAACIQKTCPLLYQGRIYKCSTAGLLESVLAKLGNPNLKKWLPYIDRGIGPDSDIDDIISFVDNFGFPNARCRQCPTKQDTVINHRTMIFDRRQSASMISNISS